MYLKLHANTMQNAEKLTPDADFKHMAVGVFDKEAQWTWSSGMRLKQKIQETNFIFTALPLIETSSSFCVYCTVTHQPYLPTRYNTKCNFSGNFCIQHHVSFQHKARDQTPLNLGKKGGGGRGGEARFKCWTNDIQKLWTCWCAGSGLRLNWIMRGHPLHMALMMGEAGRCRGEGEEGRRSEGRTIMFRSKGGGWVFPLDAASEPFKSDSQWRWKKTTKACGQEAENQEPRDEFTTRQGGRRGRGAGTITVRKCKRHKKNKNPALQAEITSVVCFLFALSHCGNLTFCTFLICSCDKIYKLPR